MPYAVGTFASRAAVMSGSAIHLAARRVKEKALDIAADALEVDRRGPADRRRRRLGQGRAGRVHRPGHRVGALQPAALRLRRGLHGGHPVLGRRPRQAARGGGRRTGARGEATSTPRSGPPSPPACTRSIVETDPLTAEITHPEVRRRPRLRQPDQPDDRRGPDPRRGRPGSGRRALRADGLRRVRAAAERLVHGLPDALRHRGPGHRSTSTTSRPRRRSTRSASRVRARPG